MSRRTSRLRSAFERACEGAAKQIAYAAFPDTSLPTAQGKLHRALAADGDLNPNWALLDAVAEHEPFVLLDALCELAGADWKRKPERAEDLAQQAVELGSQVSEQLDLFSATVVKLTAALEATHERKPPIRVGLDARRRKESA